MSKLSFMRRAKRAQLAGGKDAASLPIVESRYLEAMVAHARQEYPNEGCGIVAGVRGRIVKFYPTKNIEQSPARYVVDAREQLDIMLEMEAKGWDLLGIFHSHTHSPAYPSPTDIQLAYYPEALHFIASLMDGVPTVRAFYIRDGKIEEQKFTVG
jgi:proteasome lid subunit RPN8/RPN11